VKNKFIILMAILSCFLIVGASQVYAYSLLTTDVDPIDESSDNYWDDGDKNPQALNNSGDAAERAWLYALLGFDPGEAIDKDDPLGDPIVDGWGYAILKYGNTSVAVEFGNDGFYDDVSDSYVFPLYSQIFPGPNTTGAGYRLSHVTYFAGGRSVPEPQTWLLLGTGLIGLAAVGRRRIRKN
jgi:hypothetical protein